MQIALRVALFQKCIKFATAYWYCRAIGDLHPLYFHEEYARKSRHGGLMTRRDDNALNRFFS